VAGTLAPQGIELLSQLLSTPLAREIFEICTNQGVETHPLLAGNVARPLYDIFCDR
jgi:hypothetical protein